MYCQQFRLIIVLGGVTGKETTNWALLAEKGRIQTLGCRAHIAVALMFVFRGLIILTMIIYLHLLFGHLGSNREWSHHKRGRMIDSQG